MKYLVCLPVLNEEQSIAATIRELQAASHDFIISDAGSTDASIAIAKELQAYVQLRSGRGKGFAVIDSLRYCEEHNYDGLILLDCDRTYAVDDISLLIDEFSDSDLVVGCRSFDDISFFRRLANRLMTNATNLIFNAQVQDVASGMRMLRVSQFIGKVDAQSFDVEPQIHAIALKNNFRINEVKISYSHRLGQSKINLLHLVLILYRLLLEKFK
ncbi:MAG: glycosyltransferase [Flavobacteriales bacterium]|nr:glycosyltransferase [Flavobacteriales bacterium]